MAPLTPPIRVWDPRTIEPLLAEEPVTTAVTWNRAFDMEGAKELYVDGNPPRAVLAIARPPWAEGGAGIAMHARDPQSARALMPAWPKGRVFFHLSEDWMLPLAEERATEMDGGTFWLFRLDPQHFVDYERDGVRPLGAEWAGLVARTWDPDWSGAEPFVRGRIEAGHAYAVYEAGRPVAWALTHFDTPKVSMMGFLHVLEPYRRKGYARSVSSALVKDILERGKVPALHIKTDNVPSLEMTTSLGFRRVKRQVWADAVMR